jgi:hypothetical protein
VTSLYFEIELSLTPTMVSPMRTQIEAKVAGVLGDEDAEARIAMAAHEFLENAAKYSSDGKARLRIEIAPMTREMTGEMRARVDITLFNRSTPEHIEQLRTSFAEMRAEQDAFTHYFTLMRRNARIGSISRLGLARVRAEGEMNVALHIEGEAVTIVASMAVAAPG